MSASTAVSANPGNVPQTQLASRQWLIGTWYLEKDQCKRRSFLIARANGTYVLEEFDTGIWTLSGTTIRLESRAMFLGNSMSDGATPNIKRTFQTDRIDYVDKDRMIYTVSSSGLKMTLTRCQ